MKPLDPVREEKYKTDVQELCYQSFIEINHMRRQSPKARKEAGYNENADTETLIIVGRTLKAIDKLSDQLLKSYR